MGKVVFVQAGSRESGAFGARLGALVRGLVESGRTVAVVAGTASMAGKLDALLWTFEEGSFLPHSVLGPDTSPLEPVVVVTTAGEVARAGAWVNFSDEPIPAALASGGNDSIVYEMVSGSAGMEGARRKWGIYKQAQADLSHEKW